VIQDAVGSVGDTRCCCDITCGDKETLLIKCRFWNVSFVFLLKPL
jgi:hypothetical protein